MDPRDPALDHLVCHTLQVYDGQSVDTVVLCLAEVMARILVHSSCDPDLALVTLAVSARRWVSSGVLEDWPRLPMPRQ